MGYYVGLDVSLKSTHICVLDGERRVVWRGVSDTQIAMIAEHLARWGKQILLVGRRNRPALGAQSPKESRPSPAQLQSSRQPWACPSLRADDSGRRA